MKKFFTVIFLLVMFVLACWLGQTLRHQTIEDIAKRTVELQRQ